MNKKLFIIKSSLFTIVTLLMLIAYTIGINSLMTTHTLITYSLLLILVIISIIDFIKKQDTVNYDMQYNYLFITVNVFMLIVLTRTFLDNNIVTTGLSKLINEDQTTKMVFLGNNLIYFNILLFSLLIYRLTLIKDIKKILKKRKTKRK
ncbi:MAG: hypothetical protein PHN42_02355 [Bacilli bacterium]|nr:hypothetical protein [Bacilli bacterium]